MTKSTTGSSLEMLIMKEAREISNIFIEAQECVKIMEYLLLPDPKNDVYNKRSDSFWVYSASMFADQSLLKLNIMFAKNEHFSLLRFFEKLKPGAELGDFIPLEKVEEWIEQVLALKSGTKKISNRRNKLIAHRERGYKVSKSDELTLTELQQIVSTIQHILKEIYFLTSGAAFQIDDPIGSPVKSLVSIMQTLNEKKREYLAPLFAEARKYGLEEELPKSERDK